MSNTVRAMTDACLAAMIEHHKDQCRQNGVTYSMTDTDPLSGSEIAARFASQAATKLSQDQLGQLLVFLKTPRPRREMIGKDLKQSLKVQLEEFYSREPQLSRQAPDRLTKPGGPEDADLGIIMHLQTKQGAIDKFWDQESATIAQLQEKGLNGIFAFGYDWHWRAEISYKDHRNCPAREWEPSVRKLHDGLSTAILDLLPLPFVITASACAKENFRKTLGKDAVSLELIPETASDKLVLDLDFRDDRLRRMVLHVHHPISGFLNAMDRRPAMAAQLDAGLNFFLWLIGRNHSPRSFREAYARRGGLEQAPLAELWTYVKKELNEQRILPLKEYTPSFVAWVGSYTKKNPRTLASQGISLVSAAAAKLRHALSEASIRREAKKREIKHEKRRKALSGLGPRKRLQDNSVESEAARKNKIPTRHVGSQSSMGLGASSVPEDVRTSNFATRGGEVAGSGYSTAKNVASQSETEANDQLQVDTTQNYQAEIGPSSDEDLVMQELCESYFAYDIRSANQGEEGDRIGTDILSEIETTEHGTSSDSEVMSTQNDAVFRSYFQEYPIDYKSHTSYDCLFHGKAVKVTDSGYVNLIVDSDTIFVKFRIKGEGLKAIRKSEENPTIHFSPTYLRLCIGQQTVYKTPNERLIRSSNGILWFDLILHELKAIYGSLESRSQIDDNMSSKTDPLAQNHWKSNELQRRLLHGDIFHCGKMGNGTGMGRVFFRDVAVFVPEHADFETVYVQCFLTPDGSRHPNACVEACAAKNPANRLAIQVRFKNTTTGSEEEVWATLRGNKDFMKVNSLVDFLEGKPEEYTEQQPLRFLPRSATKRRPKISYTPDF